MQELLTVEQHVVSLHSQCSALTDRIGAAKAQTQSVLDQTKALVDKKCVSILSAQLKLLDLIVFFCTGLVSTRVVVL
jgi:hypothetical protein